MRAQCARPKGPRSIDRLVGRGPVLIPIAKNSATKKNPRSFPLAKANYSEKHGCGVNEKGSRPGVRLSDDFLLPRVDFPSFALNKNRDTLRLRTEVTFRFFFCPARLVRPGHHGVGPAPRLRSITDRCGFHRALGTVLCTRGATR